MNTETTLPATGDNSGKLIHLVLGPAIFLLAQFLPFLGPPPARVGFGILFWMVYWWVTVAVDIKVTCLVPLFVAAIYQYMPLDKVMQAYVHKEFYLIAGATAVTAAWARWGFAKRMGLKFLLQFGNGTRMQMVGWFWLTGLVSFVMGNTPVAAVFAPIAVSALIYAGYATFESRWNSNAASNILIAVAWGASVGGMATPIGGGQAVVTLALLEKYLGHKVFFIDWSLRMIPISLAVMTAMALFMYFFMKPEVERFNGSREFYRKELAAMGPMSFEEKAVFLGFALIVLLVMAQPLYAGALKTPYFKWLDPSPLFVIFALVLFFLPSRSVKGENLLSVGTLVKHFPVAVLFIWPASVALGRILDKTGASAVFATWLQPFIAAGDLPAIAAFSVGPNALSQVTSDTAAAGVMIPLVIEAFKNWHGLQFGSVAFVWVAGSALSWSYAVASSTGAQGIVVGFGANLKRMFVYGMVGAGISVLVTILYYYIAIVVLGAEFYILPPSA